MGHIGVRHYLHRFNMADTPYCQNPTCLEIEMEEDLEHFILLCPAYTHHREVMRQKLVEVGIHQFNLRVLMLSEDLFPMKHMDILGALLQYLYETGRVKTYF